MDSAEAMWREHLQRLGEHIRAQRRYSQLSQRQLARLADMSDTYMSQLERGLHEPSIRVLRALAEGLGLRPDELIMQAAGLTPDEGAELTTEEAIRRDARFTDAQKKALLGVVRSYVEGNADD
jgi:transcriptional regulator with XRE-family HTH domain